MLTQSLLADHGGKYDFLWWRGVSDADYGKAFYTNTGAIASYKSYIKQMLTRKNKYNGRLYGEDPNIAAWETGNELGGYLGREGYPSLTWTSNIAKYIKSLAPNHLVIDGTDGFYNVSTGQVAQGLKSPYVDIVSDHAYPRNIALLNKELTLATKANKNVSVRNKISNTTGHG